MKMTTEEPLPIILVSAVDAATGRKFISELIENPEAETNEELDEYVWQIENKYYTAAVCVRLQVDGAAGAGGAGAGGPRAPPTAHVVLLTEPECVDGGWLAARAAGGGGAVRLAAAAAAAGAARAVRGAALALRYELVPLQRGQQKDEDDEDGDEEEEEECGMARVRAALHAHTWSSLVRRGAGGGAAGGGAAGRGAAGGGAAGGGAAVERAELFADLLGQLGEARGGGGGRGERLARAEQLVAAFCRALHDDDDPDL